MEKIKEWLYFNGAILGVSLITLPIAWDCIHAIWHHAFVRADTGWGLICQIIGIICVLTGGRNAK